MHYGSEDDELEEIQYLFALRRKSERYEQKFVFYQNFRSQVREYCERLTLR